MTDPSPIHLLADPPAETVAVAVTMEPRPLTVDEQNQIHALRLPFEWARKVVEQMVPSSYLRRLAVSHLDQAEAVAVEGLEAALREGR